MMAGRKTKYTPELAQEICNLLKSGCIIADVCLKVGISQDTYFQWIKRYPEFSESVNRAKADANVGATLSLRKAMMPHEVSSQTTETQTETRLRKVATEHGISEQPYEYKRTKQSVTVSNEFDWRAALEFLKRRDPNNWAEHLIIRVDPGDLEMLNKMGFKSPAEAWQTLMENARHEYANSHD